MILLSMCRYPRANTPTTGKKGILFLDMTTHLQKVEAREYFPKTFIASDGNVVESNISDKPEKAIKEFLGFVRNKIKS